MYGLEGRTGALDGAKGGLALIWHLSDGKDELVPVRWIGGHGDPQWLARLVKRGTDELDDGGAAVVWQPEEIRLRAVWRSNHEPESEA